MQKVILCGISLQLLHMLLNLLMFLLFTSMFDFHINWHTGRTLWYYNKIYHSIYNFINKINFFSEFQAVEFSDHKFMRKVAKLNSNVLHLCFTQNTPPALLKPRHTLQNLMNLLNTDISDLGRYVSFIYKFKIIFLNAGPKVPHSIVYKTRR